MHDACNPARASATEASASPATLSSYRWPSTSDRSRLCVPGAPARHGVAPRPISFTGADGKQYVAVYAGIGGDWFLLAGDVRSDDPADVRPPADFSPDLARHTSQGGIVWLFGL